MHPQIGPTDVLIDNQRVGSVADKGFFFVDVPPGTHSVSCNKCAGTGNYSPHQTVNISIGAGESRYVLFETYATYFSRMILVDPAQGSQEILDLPYIGH